MLLDVGVAIIVAFVALVTGDIQYLARFRPKIRECYGPYAVGIIDAVMLVVNVLSATILLFLFSGGKREPRCLADFDVRNRSNRKET